AYLVGRDKAFEMTFGNIRGRSVYGLNRREQWRTSAAYIAQAHPELVLMSVTQGRMDWRRLIDFVQILLGRAARARPRFLVWILRVSWVLLRHWNDGLRVSIHARVGRLIKRGRIRVGQDHGVPVPICKIHRKPKGIALVAVNLRGIDLVGQFVVELAEDDRCAIRHGQWRFALDAVKRIPRACAARYVAHVNRIAKDA